MKNREIKFKFWCKGTSENLNFSKPRWYNLPCYMLEKYYSFVELCESPDFEVCQFTGLKDLKGRAIYEGDICNIRRFEHLDRSKKWIIGEVIWGNEHGWNFLSYYNGKGNGDYFGTRFTEANEIEIIGNIFENPELLK